MKTRLVAVTATILAGVAAPCIGEQLVLDQTFAANMLQDWTFDLSPSANGRLWVEMSNPDASADGLVLISDSNDTLWKLSDGFYYGTSSDPIINTSHLPWVTTSAGAWTHSWAVMPARVGSGPTYYVQYQPACGTQDTGMNSLRIIYEPNASVGTSGLGAPLLALTSQPQEQNSASTTFDAGSNGAMLLLLLFASLK